MIHLMFILFLFHTGLFSVIIWTILNAYFIKKKQVQCYPEKQIHPAIYTEQKRNTYFQDLDCKNLTSSLRSGLYRNMGYMCN